MVFQKGWDTNPSLLEQGGIPDVATYYSRLKAGIAQMQCEN